MQHHSLLSLRIAVTAGSLAALTLLGPVTSAQAGDDVTDGWQHSQVTEVLEPPAPATDGWSTSIEVLAEQDRGPLATVTDGWLGSIVGEQARDFEDQVRVAEATPSESSSDYLDTFALASGLLNLVLISAAFAIFFRQRHRATLA